MSAPRFDPQRSDAIRTMLIDTVEQAPARDHRRQVRIVVLAVLAALGIGVGSSAVAMAVGGIDLFGPPAATQAAVAPATPTPTPTPTQAAAPPTPAPHPLVVTGDPVAPKDILGPPSEQPAWSIDVPGAGDPCQYVTVHSVSDGYALVQSGPTRIPEDVGSNGCQPTETHLWLSLVDTRDGAVVWARDWTWPFLQSSEPQTAVSFLGTSGKVLVRTTLMGIPASEPYPFAVPNEVLDLASGATLGDVAFSNSSDASPVVFAVADDSGDVVVGRQKDAGTYEVTREDPVDPETPRWSIELATSRGGITAVPTDSSVLAIGSNAAGAGMVQVVDIDSGAVMFQGPSGRYYSYLRGVTLRTTWTAGVATSVAGIDDAGNEFWSREDAAGLNAVPLMAASDDPLASGVPTADVLLEHSDGRLESVDGLTGQTRWVADGSACRRGERFTLAPDGVVIQWASVPSASFGPKNRVAACAFTPEGDPADVGARPDPEPNYESPRGWAAVYDLEGGWGNGGTFSYKYHSPEGTVPTATVRDAITGETLWTRPIATDERWEFAGGYLVGLSGGKMFGIG